MLTAPNETLAQRVARLPWQHQIDLGGGVVTRGNTKLDVLEAQAAIYFRDGVWGKTVIDVGCWDGYNSFEAKRRGAKRVLATDHFAWSDKCWGKRESFETARAALELDVEARDIDLPEINVGSVGLFEVVLFLGVFYHLRNPFLALEELAKVCTDTMIIETHLDAMDNARPAMIFYPTNELGNDDTNWWEPNPACVMAMLRDLRFRPEYVLHPIHANRGIFFGRR